MNGLSLGKVMVTQVMPSAVQAKRGPKKKPPKELPCPKCKKVFAKEILLQVSSSFCMNVKACMLWHCGLWSFQAGGTKLERFLHKNQHTERKLLNFKNWVNEVMSKSAKI